MTFVKAFIAKQWIKHSFSYLQPLSFIFYSKMVNTNACYLLSLNTDLTEAYVFRFNRQQYIRRVFAFPTFECADMRHVYFSSA